MKYLIISLITLLFYSCKSSANKDYIILNQFLNENNITLLNLQSKIFCFKELHLRTVDLKALNIDINEDECNSQIELEKEKIFTKIEDSDDDFKSRISLPLLSKDSKFMYIVVQKYNSNNVNILVINTVYKLEKRNKVWRIIDKYETIIQS